MGKLEAQEKAAIRWVLGQILVLLSFAGCFSIDLGSSWMVVAGLIIAGCACLVPSFLEDVPKAFWKITPWLLLSLIAADFLFSRGDFLPPLFRMVLLLTIYRSLQIRTPREDLQLVLLTLFLIIVTGVFSQDISFGLQLIFYTPIALGLLFMANLSTHGVSGAAVDMDGPVFVRGQWLALWKHVLQRIDKRTLLAGSMSFIMASVLTFFLFIALPRFDIGAALPFPRLQTGQSLTGFTDHVRFGDVVSILNDESIAMRVDVEMEDPPARPYWRMVVLDAYYDGGFMVSSRVARDRRNMTNYFFEFENLMVGEGDDSIWTIYLEGGISSYLPIGDSFKSIRFNNRIQLQLHELTRVFRTTEANANTLSVRLEGMEFTGRLPVAPEDFELTEMTALITETGEPDYLRSVKYPQTLLVSPAGTDNERILRETLEGAGYRKDMPVQEFASSLVGYLQEDRGYSLESRLPAGDADHLLRWVESGQPGHCELYAGAFVLVARYAGYPTRMVTGYVGGDWNGYESYFMVRNRNAHAWCEILDPEIGWIRVDPTPGYDADAGSVANALAGGGLRLDRTWQAYLDSLRVLWFRRVIQFDSEDQQDIAVVARDLGVFGLNGISSLLKDWREALRNDWSIFKTDGKWGSILLDFLIPVFVILLILVLIFWIRKRSRRKNFEQLMRERAGWILRMHGREIRSSSAMEYRKLQAIRYGEMHEWPSGVEEILKSFAKGA